MIWYKDSRMDDLAHQSTDNILFIFSVVGASIEVLCLNET